MEIKNRKGEKVTIIETDDLPEAAQAQLDAINAREGAEGNDMAQREAELVAKRRKRNAPKKMHGRFVASHTKANGNRHTRRMLGALVRTGKIEIVFEQKDLANLRALLGEGL